MFNISTTPKQFVFLCGLLSQSTKGRKQIVLWFVKVRRGCVYMKMPSVLLGIVKNGCLIT